MRVKYLPDSDNGVGMGLCVDFAAYAFPSLLLRVKASLDRLISLELFLVIRQHNLFGSGGWEVERLFISICSWWSSGI